MDVAEVKLEGLQFSLPRRRRSTCVQPKRRRGPASGPKAHGRWAPGPWVGEGSQVIMQDRSAVPGWKIGEGDLK
jgi:hypothetical protein